MNFQKLFQMFLTKKFKELKYCHFSLLKMMFFYSLLHSLLQYPKDYLAYGISHCKEMPIQISTSSPTNHKIKEEQIPLVVDSITKKIKASYQSISNEYINFILDNIQTYMNPIFWTFLKCVNIAINILDPVSKSSMLFFIRFDNSKSLDPFLFEYQMSSIVSSNISTIKSSFISLTIFDIIDSKIQNVQSKTLPQITITKDILTSISIPTNLFLGNPLFDSSFIKQAIPYLSENYPRLLSTLKYITNFQSSDILQIFDKYLSQGWLDLTELQNEWRNKCSPVLETSPIRNIMKIPEFVKPHRKRHHLIRRPIRY